MVYAIASNQIESQVVAFANQFNLSFPVLLDENGSVAQQYQMLQAFPTAAYPQDWIIDSNGQIVYQNNGFEIDTMQTIVESLLQ